MKKTELIAEISNESGFTKVDCNILFDAVCRAIYRHCYIGDEEIQMGDLGKFKPKVNKARAGRNPSSGEIMQIPETRTISFKVSNKAKSNKVDKKTKEAADKKTKAKVTLKAKPVMKSKSKLKK